MFIYNKGAFGQELKWNLLNPKTFQAFISDQEENSIHSEFVNIFI